ncbi:hypothetical protein JCM3770_001982 [Rhodotorula araucariae]
MFDPLRRLVSGRKARLEADGFSLDLVQLTDRIIIMGFPAEGTAQLYRNKRSDVLRFLSPHEGHYRLFNLCPRSENSYDAAEFAGEVRRFPWPDHHPPPLSMVPLMVAEARAWYEADEQNVVVVHCKAGKGRSGTFAISLLLALPGLPSAPELPSDEPALSSSEGKGVYGPLDPRAVLGRSSGDIAALSLQDKLEYLLRFHTLRRMAPGAKSYGVSIASQRRWLGYWARLLGGDDPRSPAGAAGARGGRQRRIALEYVRVRGRGVNGLGKVAAAGSDRIAIQVYRYKDSLAASLREKEHALAASGEPARMDDGAWDDRGEMIVHVGGLAETSPSSSPSSLSSSSLAASSSAQGTPSRAKSPPVAASTASASTASLPTVVRGTPASSDAGSDAEAEAETALPPVSETAAHASPGASIEAGAGAVHRERLLLPVAAYLPVAPLAPGARDDPARRSHDEAKRSAAEDGGIVLDAEREVQLRFLLGKTGDKHARLGAMAALALTWFIPAFEVDPQVEGTTSKIVIKGKDLDFRKPFAGIDQVEIGWRWL